MDSLHLQFTHLRCCVVFFFFFSPTSTFTVLAISPVSCDIIIFVQEQRKTQAVCKPPSFQIYVHICKKRQNTILC